MIGEDLYSKQVAVVFEEMQSRKTELENKIKSNEKMNEIYQQELALIEAGLKQLINGELLSRNLLTL